MERYSEKLIVERPDHSSRETPLLFVHGMCHGAWCWEENYLPFFANHSYDSYAIDLPAHGNNKSEKSYEP